MTKVPAPIGKEIADRLNTSDVLFAEYNTLYKTDLEKTFSELKSSAQPEKEKSRQEHYFTSVHDRRKTPKVLGQTALCLSGGGIRSAAFALGIMQGLARLKLLSQFNYLSTVSGGGYAGAWFTAWATRVAEQNSPAAQHEATAAKSDAPGAQGAPKIAQNNAVAARLSLVAEQIQNWFADPKEAPLPLRELRKNQAFLTPKFGLVSPDTWSAVAIVVRNLLLNWLVFIPLLAGVLLLSKVIESFLIWRAYTGPGGPILVALSNSAWALIHLHPTLPEVRLDPHYWLDGVVVVLVAYAIGSSMAGSSALQARRMTEHSILPRPWAAVRPIV